MVSSLQDHVTLRIFYNSMSTRTIGQPAITCSKLQPAITCSGVFIVNFGHISHLFLVFLLLTLNMLLPAGFVTKFGQLEDPKAIIQFRLIVRILMK